MGWPELEQTGWSGGDHPEWKCHNCNRVYWKLEDGTLTDKRPFDDKNKAPPIIKNRENIWKAPGA
jgi:hypothetical protein